jgi:hypothetical protein
MIYEVTKSSPTRYHIQGADSGSEDEEIDYRKIRERRTVELAKDIFDNPPSYLFALEIKFKNIFRGKEVIKQVLKADRFEVDAFYQNLTCHFLTDDDNPVFFSYNHEARYSRATLFCTGPKLGDQRERMAVFSAYLSSSSDPEYTISSLDLSLRVSLKLPDQEALKKIKPPVVRKLFDEEEVQTSTVYSINNQLKLGAIFQVDKAKVTVSFS